MEDIVGLWLSLIEYEFRRAKEVWSKLHRFGFLSLNVLCPRACKSHIYEGTCSWELPYLRYHFENR